MFVLVYGRLVVLGSGGINEANAFLLFFSAFTRGTKGVVRVAFPISRRRREGFFALGCAFVHRNGVAISGDRVVDGLLRRCVTTRGSRVIRVPSTICGGCIRGNQHAIGGQVTAVRQGEHSLG